MPTKVPRASHISSLDLLSLMKESPMLPKMYLSSRDLSEERLAMGAIATLDGLPSREELQGGATFYGALPFDICTKGASPWSSPPSTYFFQPEVEIILKKDPYELILKGISYESLKELLAKSQEFQGRQAPSITSREDTPCKEQWLSLVDEALVSIQTTQLKKVVLSRITTLESLDDINPYQVTYKLLENQKNTTIFYWQMSDGASWIGSSPEKLYERRNDLVDSEALAGTAPKTAGYEDLLSRAKEMSEVSIVEEFLESKLQSLSLSVTKAPSFSLLETPHLYHLYKNISCHIPINIQDTQIINALHPTPAVGGYPSDLARGWIRDKEPHSRGYYASPIGFISDERTDLSIAIRSIIIAGKKAHLFAGAGIVEGSSPHDEWQELEHKISQYMEMFSC